MAFGDGAWPDFEALQQRMNISIGGAGEALAGEVPVTYLAFDLLWLNGRSLLEMPYARRRQLLDELSLNAARWQVPPSFASESGADIQDISRQHHLEGVVAKRVQSRDTSRAAARRRGGRSRTCAARRS